MKNIFRGNLSGYLCEESRGCNEFLSNVEVLLYLPYPDDVSQTIQANEKQTFHLVSDEEVKRRENLLIARTITDEKGNFEFSVEEKLINSAFDIDFVCRTVPPKFPPKNGKPVQFHITTLQPEWEFDEAQQYNIFNWKYQISSKWWCYIKEFFFDVWTICGQLLDCRTDKPIEGASVTAFDADFITDDNLGSTTTDANGYFRISYNSTQFKQTFLSPWINLETDPGPGLSFQSGPDVYFKAELAGVTLVNETKKDARINVPYCLCVRLCSEINVIDPNDPNGTFPSAWTGFGNAFTSSFGSGDEDFDAEGYAGKGKYALYGSVNLTGQAALKTTTGNPIKYRFLISNVTTPNNGSSPVDTDFTKIIGKDAGLFVPSKVLELYKKVQTGTNLQIPVISAQSDFDVDGWFDAQSAIDRALTNLGLAPSDIANYDIIEDDTLITLNTAALTTAVNLPDNLVNAGQTIPNANKIPIEKVAIRFEVKDAVTNLPISGSGKTLNSVIINNNFIFRKLSIDQLEINGLCSPISGDLNGKYTVYHPHLGSVSMTLNNNSNTVNRGISDGTIPFPAIPSPVDTTIDERTNGSSKLNNPPNDMIRCTYTLKLHTQIRLHNGDNAYSLSPIEQIFFYDV